MRPFWSFRDELSVQNGIIYKGHQVLVPQSPHQDMLAKIHANRVGAASNIRMAYEVPFWPGMRKSIRDICDGHLRPIWSIGSKGTNAIPTHPNKAIVDSQPRSLRTREELPIHDTSILRLDRGRQTRRQLSVDSHRENKYPFGKIWRPSDLPHWQRPKVHQQCFKRFSATYGF